MRKKQEISERLFELYDIPETTITPLVKFLILLSILALIVFFIVYHTAFIWS
jgi:hypothetical protein